MRILIACTIFLAVAACKTPPLVGPMSEVNVEQPPLTGNAGKVPEGWRIPGGSEGTATAPGAPAADRGGTASTQSAQRTRVLASEAHLRGEFEKAAVLWGELMKLEPENGEAAYNRARSLARAGKVEGAAVAMREAWTRLVPGFMLSSQPDGMTSADEAAYQIALKELKRFREELDFSPIKDDPVWVGLTAELEARTRK